MTPRKGIRRLCVEVDLLWQLPDARYGAKECLKRVLKPLLCEMATPRLGPTSEPAIDQNEGSNALYCS